MKLRFAPSPSGLLHIANARIALLNYLEARKKKASLILRIEDTDVARSTEENEKQIIEDLKWLGIVFDKYYRQQERLNLYREKAELLIKSHKAYRCFCGKQKLKELKEKAIKQGIAYRYPGFCRNISDTQSQNRANKEAYVVRMKIDEPVILEDIHRGKIRFDAGELDDFIILREDETATYNFACAIDDMDMGIDEVIRGDDHITNTARQIAVFNALNKIPPVYIHIPTMLDENRKKISKRVGGNSIKELREKGILPEAIISYLASLGREKEFSVEELIENFSIERISKSNPVFDFHRLLLINESFIKTIDDTLLLKHLAEFEPRLSDQQLGYVPVFRNNARDLAELIQMIDEFIDFHPDKLQEDEKETLRLFIKLLKENDFSESISKLAKQTGKRGKVIYHPIRIALTGKEKGPSLVEIVAVFGKENTIKRLSEAL